MHKKIILTVVFIFIGIAAITEVEISVKKKRIEMREKMLAERRRMLIEKRKREITALISSAYPIQVIDETKWSPLDDPAAYRLFQKIGWVKVKKWSINRWTGGKYPEGFKITDEGKKHLKLVEELLWNSIRIKICKMVFKEITGIMMEGTDYAKVTYRWEYGDFCPHYQEIKKLYKKGYLEGKYENQVYESTVRCGHYDTGWKLER